MNNLKILKKTSEFVQETLKQAEKGHDWWHILRVRNMALFLAEKEGGDKTIIELAALLHDISDAKFNGGDLLKGPQLARSFLIKSGLDDNSVSRIERIIAHISFKGGIKNEKPNCIEFAIVQDADRIDAIGAIGIARTFQYGGFKNREIYNPGIAVMQYSNPDEYYRSTAPTINHFYEKLLLLKDLMNTETAKKIAAERHRFMEQFLNQFYSEWNFGSEKME
jgi:uncharacterized protein